MTHAVATIPGSAIQWVSNKRAARLSGISWRRASLGVFETDTCWPRETGGWLAPLLSVESSRELIELTIVANFLEVQLAKEGHDGLIGINLVEKI
jgi:hypothetical protein